jgi:RNA polymerase sigma-70 factor (ECF subfamily)
VSLLTDDVVLLTDGGADVRAARFPIRGRDRVARLLVRVLGRRLHWMEMRYTQVNGSTGFMLLSNDGDVVSVGSIDVRDDRIAEIDWVINPDKLAWITPP